jgi:hypothetical protein
MTFGLVLAEPYTSKALAADFPSIVSQILKAQTDGPVSKMSAAKKQSLINCVNKVLVGLPAGRKRFVVEGANFDEQERRFGTVVMENRAEWKQNIAKACSKIAMQGGV